MIDYIYIGLQLVATAIVFVSAWGLLPLDNWWVRVMDFPRIQFICLGALAVTGLLFFVPDFDKLQWVLLSALLLALAYQLYMILPYTRLWKKQVREASNQNNAVQVKIMVSNVLTPNDNTPALVNLVRQKQPDILITLESDQKWQDALDTLSADYPYSVKVPLDNLYGMHLYSKLELFDPEVKYLIVDDIPSIHTQIRLENNELVWLYCLHPMPPSPTEADKSTTRDAELLLVGRHIRDSGKVAIVAGDLNDVAWSKTTRMFQRISQLLDPRVGRVFVNTFHAKYPFLRWALDHIFHSPCFTLVDIQRQPSIGSDHFPVLTTLQYEPQLSAIQAKNADEMHMQDTMEAHEKIAEGIEEGSRVSAEHRQNA